MDLDPLIGLDNPRMPLRSKLLAVPEYRQRYLRYVRQIADESLDWKSLGPVVMQYRTLIFDGVEAETRSLHSFDAFARVTSSQPDPNAVRGRELPLRTFADQRRAYLLDHPEVKKVAK